MTDLTTAYRFMRDNAGYVVGRRAEGALALARAERLLQTAIDERCATVDWRDDDEPYEHGYMTDDEIARFGSGAWTGPYGCVIRVNGEHVASLWGIVLDQWGTNDPYARVVAAELAAEAQDELRQAIGDTRDAAQDVTFA